MRFHGNGLAGRGKLSSWWVTASVIDDNLRGLQRSKAPPSLSFPLPAQLFPPLPSTKPILLYRRGTERLLPILIYSAWIYAVSTIPARCLTHSYFLASVSQVSRDKFNKLVFNPKFLRLPRLSSLFEEYIISSWENHHWEKNRD